MELKELVVRCFLVIVFTYSCATGFYLNKESDRLSPVIFVPGDGGSQLDAKLNKSTVVHYMCDKRTDWFNAWLNMELLVPFVIDCWIDNVRLIYDNDTRTTDNPPGVQTRVPGWGDPEVVEWIDPSRASTGAYFKDIGNALVNLGYERGRSIRGAPYDFRKAPNENKQWFIDMKELVEETYNQNGRTAVTLITHSMGSPMSMLFLQNQPQKWKRKYIAKVISLAGAWAGSVKAVKVYAMGDDLGSLMLSAKTMRAEQISSPSLAWLLPSPYFWKSDEVLVESPARTYTLAQLRDYFDDINYLAGWEMRQDTMRYTMQFTPPDVELHCLYGTNIPTVEKLVYKKAAIAGEIPKLVTGDGDGTVNLRSLEACMHWQPFQQPNISMFGFPGVDHMTILKNDTVIKHILDVLSNHK